VASGLTRQFLTGKASQNAEPNHGREEEGDVGRGYRTLRLLTCFKRSPPPEGNREDRYCRVKTRSPPLSRSKKKGVEKRLCLPSSQREEGDGKPPATRSEGRDGWNSEVLSKKKNERCPPGGVEERKKEGVRQAQQRNGH